VTGPYRCPTLCDPDCEINGWGCHEGHDVPSRREHDPEACEARTAMGNLRWLAETGRFVQLGRCGTPDGFKPMYFAAVRMTTDRITVNFYGASVAEAAGATAAPRRRPA
jgi:hypothetical protein